MSNPNSIPPDGMPPTDLSPEDPRLTAYALDPEFSSGMEPDEAAAIERLLEASPEARAEVEALRSLGDELERGFASMPAGEGLDAARKDAVLAPHEETEATPRRGGHFAFRTVAALAACLLCGVAIFQIRKANDGLTEGTTESSELTAGPTGREAGTIHEPAPAAWGELFPEAGEAVPGGEADPATLPGLTPTGSPAPMADPRAQPAPVTEVHLPGSGPAISAGSQPEEGLRDERARDILRGLGAQGAGHAQPSAAPQPVTGAPTPTTPAGVGATPNTATTTGLYGGAGGALPPARVGYISPGRPTFGSPATKVGLDNVTHGRTSYKLELERAGTTLALRYKGWYPGGQWTGYNVQVHGEQYVHPGIDTFLRVTKRSGHTSTFSVDVDSASYSNVRRLLTAGQRPHPAAVRIEEFVNYFDYAYPAPAADAKEPFAQHIQVAACPWNPKHRLARIALKGKEIQREARPTSNLVFLVDVSGSMRDEDKLPLLQSGLEMLVENLDARDRISIVTYASTATLALESTNGDQRDVLLAKIRSLKAGGGTNGAGGIQLAYAEAQKHFQKEGVNRVILCTDGDFNVGVADGPGLTRLVQEKAKGGVYLSVLGFGTGNLQDGKMEAYSNAGNGNYAYLDSLAEARRVLVEQMEGTLITIAKDVKFQVWFNPKTVHAWRLLGYENRRLAAKDFNDDSKDAGDIGAGHEVTALYELVPTGVGLPNPVDANPFVAGPPKPKEAPSPKAGKDQPQPQQDALFIWRLRWKQPDGSTSALVERNVFDKGLGFEQADRDFQWAAGVTAFGMLLRHSPHRGQASYALVEELTGAAKGADPMGRRAEFLGLVAKAQGK